MNQLKRTTLPVNGLNIFCRDTVEGEQTILCLHGKWGRGETWTDFIARYRDRYRIIAPDQRGHGLSDKPVARYSPSDMATDMAALIQALDCGPVIVVGHSMGGCVGTFLATQNPLLVKALAILDQTAAGPETVSDLPPEKVLPVDDLTVDWPTPYPTYNDALAHLRGKFEAETNLQYFLDSLEEAIEGYDFMFSPYAMAAIAEYRQNWYHLLPQINCPVMLVRAEESWCLSAEDAQKMIPLISHCTYTEISGSDHMVYADNPEQFYPIFDRFLADL